MTYFKLTHPEQDDPDDTFSSSEDQDGWIKFTFSDDEDQGSDYYIDNVDTIEFDKVIVKINDVVYREKTAEFTKTFNDLMLWHRLKA